MKAKLAPAPERRVYLTEACNKLVREMSTRLDMPPSMVIHLAMRYALQTLELFTKDRNV